MPARDETLGLDAPQELHAPLGPDALPVPDAPLEQDAVGARNALPARDER